MNIQAELDRVRSELESGIALEKCLRCGCMRETLDRLSATAMSLDAPLPREEIEAWNGRMQPVRYPCLGCDHCYPAVAQNVFGDAFPQAALAPLACDFRTGADWPPVVGDYFVVDPCSPVAVSTLGSPALAQDLANRKPQGLAIVGKTETENIGIDKIVKNIVASPAIRFLILAGREPAGHQSGATLLALDANGVDASGRVIDAPGRRPILRNTSRPEIEIFRQQVQVVDMIGCENHAEIAGRVAELALNAERAWG